MQKQLEVTVTFVVDVECHPSRDIVWEDGHFGQHSDDHHWVDVPVSAVLRQCKQNIKRNFTDIRHGISIGVASGAGYSWDIVDEGAQKPKVSIKNV